MAALEAANGNKSETARQLGITRKTLHAKLRRYREA
jgi:two-component system response regulator HydG